MLLLSSLFPFLFAFCWWHQIWLEMIIICQCWWLKKIIIIYIEKTTLSRLWKCRRHIARGKRHTTNKRKAKFSFGQRETRKDIVWKKDWWLGSNWFGSKRIFFFLKRNWVLKEPELTIQFTKCHSATRKNMEFSIWPIICSYIFIINN